jgi:hypothetical protein
MGSTICVSCGAILVPYSYCDICQDVSRFVCSSCSMLTDERIHIYCNDDSIRNNNNVQKFLQMQNSSQVILNVSRHNYIQNRNTDETKNTSINLFSPYWDSIYESIKLFDRYWGRIFPLVTLLRQYDRVNLLTIIFIQIICYFIKSETRIIRVC